MSKKTLFFTMFALGLLAACSKPAPQPTAAVDDEEAAPRAVVEKPVRQETPEERARQAEGLLTLLDTSPSCQPFRDELQAAGQSGTVPINDMVQIIGRAGKAGCNKKPQ